ncbi:MAG: UDP-N-acetylmuramoyl-L-alanine--D-glutamate ligase [Patescibacteria group bacterium]
MLFIELKNKKVVLMGLGVLGGGLGTAKYLAQSGARLLITDLKSAKELKDSLKELKKYRNIRYVLGQHRQQDFRGKDLIVKNPGVPNNSAYLKIARKHNIPIETDTSLFFLINQGPVIGITGSKGKSTTATLVYQIFKEAKRQPVLAGNIRVSALSQLKKIKKRTPVILELSSWQLNSIKKHKSSPFVSVITNIFPEHLNRYSGIKAYVADKKLIFQNQTESDFVVLNKDNKITRQLGQEVVSQRYWFSRKYFSDENGCYIKSDFIFFRQNGREQKVIRVADIKVRGTHNLENILAAVCIAKIYGLGTKSVHRAVTQFKGLEDRLQLVKNYHGVKYYNDTTATHPEAVIAALDSFESKVILIAGGADKKLNFAALAKKIKQRARFLILLKGNASNKLLNELNKVKFNNLVIVDTMPRAVKVAQFVAIANDIVLLSPGAASFNLFINEFDRGGQFKQCVKGLK